MNRRDLLRLGGSCTAHLVLAGRAGVAIGAQPAGRAAALVAEETWGRLERIADGVWAVISTPLSGAPDARRTLSNGGIVAGKAGVVIVEAFASPEGARWMAEHAKRLTGRPPTHVVVTHHHGDHSAGLLGYRDGATGPAYITTTETRQRIGLRAAALGDALASAQLVEAGAPTVIDLGGRKIALTGRSGHTASDVTVLVDDPAVSFGGDLLWNHFFPNYVDAIPSRLSQAVRALSGQTGVTHVPGHGALFGADDLTHYIALIDAVEAAARKAHAAGTPAADAAKAFALPPSLGAWTMFSGNYAEVALRAWERELRG
jgi:glyoxylase-like metal-dependent hydrolase (beta-lactamase superfamily II)